MRARARVRQGSTSRFAPVCEYPEYHLREYPRVPLREFLDGPRGRPMVGRSWTAAGASELPLRGTR
jgi:hypothetical protein